MMRREKFLISLVLVVSIIPPVFPVFSAENQCFKLEKKAVSRLPGEIFAPDLKSMVVDSKGCVFAYAGSSNSKVCFIAKFDENLNFLKQFGRDGRGPAEFTTWSSSPDNRLTIAPNGDVYVIDHNPTRLVVFDNDGNYKNDIPYRRDYYNYFGHIYRFKTLGNNVFAGLKYVQEKPYIGVLLSLNPPRVKVSYQYSGEIITVSGPFGYFQVSERICGHNPLIDTDSQHVVFCDAQVYKFRVYDSSGALVLEVWDKNRNVRSFSDKEMKKIIYDKYTKKKENSNFENDYIEQITSNKLIYKGLLEKIRKNKNVIGNIHVSGERIFVFPVGEDITREHFYPVEVYKLKGQVVKSGYFREIPAEIWKDYVFFYERDKEDNPLIVKYKIDEQF